MSSFCLNNDFRLQKTNRAARRWKQPPKKPFDYVSRDKILHDSWSISAALARGSPTAILNEEKALGTRLADRELQHCRQLPQNFCSVPVLALPDTRIISSKWRLFDTVRGRLLCIQTENLFGVVFMWRKLNIDKLGIRLDLTLQSGQSFRWRETAPGEWTNVLSGYVWTLKQDQHDLFYRVFKSRSLQHLQGERILEEIQIPPNRKIDKVSKLYESILRDYFQLDVDVESLFEQWRENDPHFAEVSEKFRGVRVLRQDPVETLFSFICSSNNSITRISGMVEKLCQAYGNKLGQINGLAYYSFPDIKQLQGSRVEECLRKMGFGYRAKFICESASFILQHHDDNWLENLRSVSYHEAHAG